MMGAGRDDDELEREEDCLLKEDQERLARDEERLKEGEARIEEDRKDIERDEARRERRLRIELLVIVSGDEVKIKAKPDEFLSKVAEQALEKSEHTGRPLSDWVMRNEAGDVLDVSRTVESYGLKDGDILSLTLEAGVAG